MLLHCCCSLASVKDQIMPITAVGRLGFGVVGGRWERGGGALRLRAFVVVVRSNK